MKKPGVVIFLEDDSSVDLAALQWVAQALPKNFSQRVDILFIEDISKKDSLLGKDEDFKVGALIDVFKGDARKTFDAERTRKESGIKDAKLHGKRLYYEETNTIQQILKKAIEDLKLDTLVLPMAAVGSNTTRYIDLQKDSKCSVVLATTDTKPLEKPFIISATPVYKTPPPDPINVVEALIQHTKEVAKAKDKDHEIKKAKATVKAAEKKFKEKAEALKNAKDKHDKAKAAVEDSTARTEALGEVIDAARKAKGEVDTAEKEAESAEGELKKAKAALNAARNTAAATKDASKAATEAAKAEAAAAERK